MLVFCASFLSFVVAYRSIAPRFDNLKQRAWILTMISSGCLTLASLPFFAGYVLSGFRVVDVPHAPLLAVSACRFFQAYLTADLIVGLLCYRAQIELVTGWIHHLLYLSIVQVVINRGWAHIFCLCTVMELPTFILAIASLYPKLRSNVLFALSFFATRISFHITLAVSYVRPSVRAAATQGSLLPAILLAAVFPLHAMWFAGCVKGFVRRYKSRRASSQQQQQQLNPSSSPPPVVAVRPGRPRSASFEKVVQALRLVEVKHKSAAVGARLYGALPEREAVFDYVGLGRRSRTVGAM